MGRGFFLQHRNQFDAKGRRPSRGVACEALGLPAPGCYLSKPSVVGAKAPCTTIVAGFFGRTCREPGSSTAQPVLCEVSFGDPDSAQLLFCLRLANLLAALFGWRFSLFHS